MKRIALALSVFCSGLAASNAYAGSASSLPPAQWSSDARAVQNSTVNDLPSYLPGANTATSSDASGTSTVTITSVAAPIPYVSAEASSSSSFLPSCGFFCGGYAEGTGDIQYYLEVVDPTGSATGSVIPINVNAFGYASSTGTPAFGSTANANLWLTFYGYGASSPQYFQAVSDYGAPTSYINVNGAYNAIVGQQIFVELQTNVDAGSSFGPNGGSPYNAASAYIDPYFSLPQWAIDDGYQIELSAGMGNSPVGAHLALRPARGLRASPSSSSQPL